MSFAHHAWRDKYVYSIFLDFSEFRGLDVYMKYSFQQYLGLIDLQFSFETMNSDIHSVTVTIADSLVAIHKHQCSLTFISIQSFQFIGTSQLVINKKSRFSFKFCYLQDGTCKLNIHIFASKWKRRSSRLDVVCKKGVLRNLAKFTGKHLCQSLYFNKVAGLQLY